MLKKALVLNNTNDKREQAAKQQIIALHRPNTLANQPDTNPPDNPPIPNNIMLNPRSFCASPAVIKLCTHVGSHEKIAHKPINIVPKVIDPIKRSALRAGAKSVCI